MSADAAPHFYSVPDFCVLGWSGGVFRHTLGLRICGVFLERAASGGNAVANPAVAAAAGAERRKPAESGLAMAKVGEGANWPGAKPARRARFGD